ncbi:hypothetical protein V6N12_070273 [Hibiscus sabdariffa]|uniref:Uncharacterized protein n=1 Tax=Hibiscus sabdariffa TaxID=183260 RepID=A0ABR2FGG8_9ROSI
MTSTWLQRGVANPNTLDPSEALVRIFLSHQDMLALLKTSLTFSQATIVSFFDNLVDELVSLFSGDKGYIILIHMLKLF